jgi:polyhydroxyalkanoate synthesis repressor PhaR
VLDAPGAAGQTGGQAFGRQGGLAPPGAGRHAPRPDLEGGAVPVLIKRYRNRRLYDTGRSAYITLDDLAGDLASGREVRVVDAATGEDLTRRTMVQVLLTEAHVHKLEFLPDDFLRTLIRLEDQSLIRLFSHYIKMTLSSFSVAQSAVHQNLELLRNMAPGPADFVSTLAGWLTGDKRPSRAPGRVRPPRDVDDLGPDDSGPDDLDADDSQPNDTHPKDRDPPDDPDQPE